MGLTIECVDERAAFPRPTQLTLRCDGDHGLFAPAPASFRHPDGFMVQYREAIAAGWKDTFEGGCRVFLGPCCSGKTSRS